MFAESASDSPEFLENKQWKYQEDCHQPDMLQAAEKNDVERWYIIDAVDQFRRFLS